MRLTHASSKAFFTVSKDVSWANARAVRPRIGASEEKSMFAEVPENRKISLAYMWLSEYVLASVRLFLPVAFCTYEAA